MSFLLRLWVYGLVVLVAAVAQAQGVLEIPSSSTQHIELARSDSQKHQPDTSRVGSVPA